MVGALVFSVFAGAGVLFTVITGEKTQRVTEAIVSAVSPQAWIDGKILGTSLFVLAYLVSYTIGLVIAFLVYGVLDGALPQLPALVTDPALGIVTVVFAALGVGFLGLIGDVDGWLFRFFALGIHMTGKEPSAREVWRWLRDT